ncbi:MAG: EAL domain-containing protein [Actinomycetota bacterium]|nr:EAL domain-containing protein [Actinomycetota bacterium]
MLDSGARRLLTSIVRVCQSLDLPLIAEGIETAELAVLLAEVGCDHGQG